MVAILIAARFVSGADSGVSSRVTNEAGRVLVTLSNPYEELTFEPALGGRCVSFRFLDDNEQLIGKGSEAAMFLDHWSKYPWPSGLMRLPYQHEVVKDGETRIGLKQWVVVPPAGGGKGEGATSPELVGLIVRKTVWLDADHDGVQVDHEIENPTRESRGVGLYVQHNFNLRGDIAHDIWYLPSAQGVVYNIQPTEEGGKIYGTDWVLEPTAGWMGVRDHRSRRGLIFAFDYNYLQKIYTCGSTAEWFLETVPVAPGKSFKTTHVIKPVYDFEDFAHASKHIVADIRGTERGKEVEVALDVAAVSQPLSGVILEVTVTGWRSKRNLASETFRLDSLGFDKTRQTFRIPSKGVTDGVVIQATAKGPDFEERFETYYAGNDFEHERRYGFFAVKGGALAGAQADAYIRKPPRKVKHFDKP
ncbi:MAG: hypothetical protein JW951_01760, partial [Lentisphaerae bacterium]|nr:hypothetical protein [Lentisphaerota bacterium]